MQRGPREPTRQTGRKSSGIGLNSRGLHDLFVAHARHRIGFLVHIDANVDNPATIGEALVCHGEFLIKALRVSVLERIFSFFPSLSAIPRELIQHSDFFIPCLYIAMAQDGEVAYAFQPSIERVAYFSRVSFRPSGRFHDRGRSGVPTRLETKQKGFPAGRLAQGVWPFPWRSLACGVYDLKRS